jgi:RNA polymerase sigma-70 factor, ECF subfamily
VPDETALEARWITACRDGDTEAFGFLVERHRGRVFRLAYGMLRNAEEAEDVAQEAFVKAYEALRTFDTRRPFGAWIAAIASRTAIDRMRRRKRAYAASEGVTIHEEAVRSPADDRADDAMARAETREALWRAIDSLDGRMRAVLWLKDVEGRETAEVAETLDIDCATVRVHLFKARARLRDMLRDFAPAKEERR